MKIRYSNGDTADVDLDRARGAVESGSAVLVDLDAIAEVPSQIVAEAEARKAYAKTEYATLQEKRQAKVEEDGDARGDNARLHAADVPSVAVADKDAAKEAVDAMTDSDELSRNKGPVEYRPDSAGVSGLPGEAIGDTSPAAEKPAAVKKAAKR